MRRASDPAGNVAGFGAGLDRRALLLGRLAGSADAGDGAGQAIPQHYLRQINGIRCTGCDVCTRVCPQQALRLHQQDQRTFYVVEPGLCDGCGVCVELCEAGAIDMAEKRISARPQLVELFSRRCRGCHVSFHLPRKPGEADSLCRICAVRGI